MPFQATPHPDVIDGLALALIASSNAPLLLEGDLSVTGASACFCTTF